jgi:hypothetical protein
MARREASKYRNCRRKDISSNNLSMFLLDFFWFLLFRRSWSFYFYLGVRNATLFSCSDVFSPLLGEEDGVLLYFGPGAIRCHPEMHVYLSRYYIGRTNA